MHVLGKVDKYVTLHSRKIPLYSTTKLKGLLQRKTRTLHQMELDGHIPKAFFKMGPKRYYSSYELLALMEATMRIGMPYRFVRGKKHPWTAAVEARWAHIRQALDEGKEPLGSVYLHFDSTLELVGLMRDILQKCNVTGEIVVQRAVEQLLAHRTF